LAKGRKGEGGVPCRSWKTENVQKGALIEKEETQAGGQVRSDPGIGKKSVLCSGWGQRGGRRRGLANDEIHLAHGWGLGEKNATR